jgi:hypothetical protein
VLRALTEFYSIGVSLPTTELLLKVTGTGNGFNIRQAEYLFTDFHKALAHETFLFSND